MKVVATTRQEQGTGASRRLRRAGKVPGIVYGGTAEPTSISIEHNPLYHSLRVEAFHSSILDLELDGKSEQVLLRDVQWHAFKPQVMHIDFQRVAADQPIHVKVPLHYMNQETAPAVKLAGGMITHVLMDVEVNCLPRDLPEFIEVDLSQLTADQTLHVSDIKFPKGVTPVTGSEGAVIVTVTVKGGGDAGEAGEEGDAGAKK